MKAEIEGLQPYHRGKDWERSDLWVIHDMCNLSKHRGIILAGTGLVKYVQGMRTAIIGQGKTDPTSDKMEMDEEFAAEITFDEGVVKGAPVWGYLNSLIGYVKNGVLPRFEGFFR
jgi:hypothetical protein